MEKRVLIRIQRVLELTGDVDLKRFIQNLILTFKLIPDPDLTIPFIPNPEHAQILV